MRENACNLLINNEYDTCGHSYHRHRQNTLNAIVFNKLAICYVGCMLHSEVNIQISVHMSAYGH